jgi:hypothetical protein
MSQELLQGWSPIQTVLKADELDDEKVHAIGKADDPDFGELYIMPLFVYGNHYLGIVSLLFQVDASDATMARNAGLKASDIQTGGGDLQLTFSHDGVNWHRQPDRQTLTASSPSGLVPCYAPCNAPLELGDELWLYYTEADSAHPAPGHRAMIRAAVWRKDGFVSLDAASRGMLKTKNLLWEGSQLRLNVDTEENGSLRVALLDEKGKVIPGYDVADCTPITGDRPRAVAEWNGKRDLSFLKGKSIRCRLELNNARLYSLRADDEPL